jgi:hypothetical protein
VRGDGLRGVDDVLGRIAERIGAMP